MELELLFLIANMRLNQRVTVFYINSNTRILVTICYSNYDEYKITYHNCDTDFTWLTSYTTKKGMEESINDILNDEYNKILFVNKI